MKRMGWIALAFVMVWGCAEGYAQPEKKKVSAVKIYDANNELAEMPQFGKKHLLIFYVDPDHANQNKEFRENLEKNQIDSDNIYGFGIVNLKDAPLLPNGIVRAMVRKKVKQTGAAIYTDPDNLVSKAWELGDCNDKFVLMFVTKEGRIEFLSKGEMTPQQIDEFWRVIDKYR